MKKIIFVTLLLFSSGIASFAQNGAQEKLEAQRVAFITNRLNLTPQEAQNFWPIYNQYKAEERQLKKSLRRPGKLQNLSDKEVEDYLDATLDVEEKELALKRSYLNKVKAILPIKKIARLMNAERAFKEMVLRRMNERRAERRNNK